MAAEDPETEALLREAGRGEGRARQLLLERYRLRLRQAVALRLDRRIAARVDPSDIVQEALADAARRLPEYLERRPVAFYPWLRGLALDRLIDLSRRHLNAQRRSVRREEPGHLLLSEQSSVLLMNQLFASMSSPGRGRRREELAGRVREVLEQLAPLEREILVLRYLEESTLREVAALLGVSERTVRRHHLRALSRLGELLKDLLEE